MILTLTLNPALDVTTHVAALLPEKKLRCKTPTYQPGGGGINVSRGLSRLGTVNQAMYLEGGATGERFTSLLIQENISAIPFGTTVWTRENITVVDDATHSQYRFTFPGSELPMVVYDAILERIGNLDPFPDFVVLSGSFPPAFPFLFFEKLKKLIEKNSSKLVVDTSGEELKTAAKQGVYLLKPNFSELCELAGIEKENFRHVKDIAHQVLTQYEVGVLVVSLGAKGAIILAGEHFYQISSPHLPVKSTVGAGDSMLAGLLYGLSLGESWEEVLKWGVACGTATTLNEGTSLFQPEQVKMVKNLIG